MKKNKMMRAASALLVATLLSTSIISGTFAKYTTSAEGSDSARVAKWGIQMDKGTDMFSDTYDAGKTATVDGNSDKVVAPGTSGSTTYKVTGAPETAYKITFANVFTSDVVIEKGATYKYEDTNESNDGKVTYTAPTGNTAKKVENDYYPIIYTVKVTSANATFTGSDVITKSGDVYGFDKLETALTELNNVTLTYEANKDANLEVELAWTWLFDDAKTAPTVTNTVSFTQIDDKLDTVLGDIKADTDELTFTGNSSTDISYKFKMTATQID